MLSVRRAKDLGVYHAMHWRSRLRRCGFAVDTGALRQAVQEAISAAENTAPAAAR